MLLEAIRLGSMQLAVLIVDCVHPQHNQRSVIARILQPIMKLGVILSYKFSLPPSLPLSLPLSLPPSLPP